MVSPSEKELRALEVARSLVRAEAQLLAAVEPLVDERLLAVAQLILSRPGKVVPTGVGTSGEIARRMAHLLSVAGTPSLFQHPTDGIHGGLGAVTKDDVVIAISKGGRSGELNEYVHRVRTLGAGVVVLTASPRSPLAEQAHVAVEIPAPDWADPAGIIAMGSSLAVAAWGDALAVVLKDLRGYGWEKVLFAHPGGAVGARAREAATQAGDTVTG